MRRKVEFELETEQLGKKKIVCYEVSPEVIISELRKKIEEKETKELEAGDAFDLLKYCCNLSPEEVMKLYPSEKKVLFEKFKQANEDFFLIFPKVKEGLEKLGVVDFLVNLIKDLKLMDILRMYITELWQRNSNPEFVNSLKQDIEDLKNTGGVSIN